MTDREKKAWKLIEALAEPCEQPDGDDHAWRRCRRCLALQELDTKGARSLLRDLLGLRTVWTEDCEPFIAWAQGYLDAGRWVGYSVFDAIKRELLERDAELQSPVSTPSGSGGGA